MESLKLVHTVTATTKFSVVMEWVQYPFMTAMAMEKMGIMESGDGIHTVTAMATGKKIELFNPFCCRCCSSVNEPLL